MKAIGNREKTKLAFSSVLVTGDISKKEAMVSVNERIVKYCIGEELMFYK